MIREVQAIEYFKNMIKWMCEDHLKICPKDSVAYQATLKEKEFYDMAIKALEQELVIDSVIESAYKTGYELGRSMAMIDCARDRV